MEMLLVEKLLCFGLFSNLLTTESSIKHLLYICLVIDDVASINFPEKCIS